MVHINNAHVWYLMTCLVRRYDVHISHKTVLSEIRTPK